MIRKRGSVSAVTLIAGLVLMATAGHAQEVPIPETDRSEDAALTAPSPAAIEAVSATLPIEFWIDACLPTSAPTHTSARGRLGLEGNFQLFHARGRRELIENRPEEAIADFTDALRLNPYDGCTYYLRALAMRRSIPAREYRAVGDLSEALRLNPGLVPAYVQRAQAYTRLAEWDKTDRALREAALGLEYAVAQVNAMTQTTVIGSIHAQAEALSRQLRTERRSRLDASTLEYLADMGGEKILGALQLGSGEERVGPAEALAYYRRALIDYMKALRLDPNAPESNGMIQVIQDRMTLLGTELDTRLRVSGSDPMHPAATPSAQSPMGGPPQ